jgi:predicted transcriptional regulator of viral defense system
MSDTNDTESIRHGLTDKETELLTNLAKDGKTIFQLEDISNFLGTKYRYTKVIADRLRKKKWIIQLTRGKYLISPLSAGPKSEYTEHEFIIASHLAKDYYIGYWSALNYYGFTEQTPLSVFVVTKSRLRNRKILGVNYKFVTIDKKKFIGITNTFINNKSVRISDKPKTIADALDHPELCGGISEVAKCLWNARKEISLNDVLKYSKLMKNNSIVKRLGYLVDLLKIETTEKEYSLMKSLVSKGYSLLDPMSIRKGAHNTKWNLLLNMSEEHLLDWRRT